MVETQSPWRLDNNCKKGYESAKLEEMGFSVLPASPP